VALPVDTRGLSVHALYRDEIVLAVSRGQPLLTHKVIEPAELANLPLVVFSGRSSTRVVLDKFFQEIGIQPHIRLEVENDEAAERAIATGAGVCFLPVGRALHDRIRFLRVRGHRIYRDVALVCPPAPRECVVRFLDLCRTHASGLENVA
jgi:DNA-binding transcriptional LysR family regulator